MRAAAKAAKAADPPPSAPPASEWQPIAGLWLARASDGRGHHDGDGIYNLDIPATELAPQLVLGGQVRFTEVNGGTGQVFGLASAPAPHAGRVRFPLQVNPLAAGGVCIIASGMEYRVSA